MVFQVICMVVGAIVGILSRQISVYLIQQRVPSDAEGSMRKDLFPGIIWSIVFAGVYGIVSGMDAGYIMRIEYMLLFSICFCTAVIDLEIRKIPNPLLLALLTGRIIFLAIRHDPNEIMMAAIGLATGFVLFLLPSFLHMNIGGGDIKFAAVVGFCIGVMNLFQTIIVMAAGMAVLAVYLLVSKKGNLKTSTAVGPFISMGVLVTILFPFF